MDARTTHRLLLTLLALLLAACSGIRTRDVAKESSTALPAATDTPSARYIDAELANHPGNSGFRILSLSTNALMSRIALADHAQQSIDLQYYIYRDDATGRLVTQRLMSAADRGVRVRVLLDHIVLEDAVPMLEKLDAHRGIEVRVFNPFHTKRPNKFSKAAQMLIDGPRLNRRMHNKSFIVDNLVAVIGGRNIGNEYFDAESDQRFRDLDLIAIGPVVRHASASFDAYWNSAAAHPLAAFSGRRATRRDTAELRTELVEDVRKFAESDYAQAVMAELPDGPTADRWGEWFWGQAVFVADDPEKAQPSPDPRALQVEPQVRALVESARRELVLVSPYFIPGRNGMRFLEDVRRRGVAVRLLTNSLSSTDEPFAFSAYVPYRRDLLRAGIELYELQPAAFERPADGGNARGNGSSSGISLHAKALVVDGRHVFVGSMNMDPRSRLLNTEMGMIVDSPPLAEAVLRYFATATAPGNAWRVALQPRAGGRGERLVWHAGQGEPALETEPGATPKKRIKVALLRLLPLDNLL